MAEPIPTNWQRLQGNRFTQRLNPRMLTTGLKITTNRALIGSSKGASELLEVTYDEAYVVWWMAKMLLIPLRLHRGKDSYNRLQKLVSKALELARQIDDEQTDQ